jgi:hypothetical protein
MGQPPELPLELNPLNGSTHFPANTEDNSHPKVLSPPTPIQKGEPKGEQSVIKKPHGLVGRSRPNDVKQKISDALKNKKKNYATWLLGKKGPAHPSYKHGQGKARVNPKDLPKYKAWQEGVYQKCHFKCVLTGETANLECHHLEGWWYEPGRFDIANGVLLHKKYINSFIKNMVLVKTLHFNLRLL